MSESAQPWERLERETARAYAAFRQYRELGPARTVDQLHSVARTSAHRWSSTHRWVERAEAWDTEAYRLEDLRRLEAIRTMDDTHARAARALITAGLRALAEGQKLTPHQAVRYIDTGTRLERATLLGEHLAPPTPVSVSDDSELSPLERIARELAGTA